MNCQQLKTEIELILMDTVTEPEIINSFNQCLRGDLASVLRLETKSTTNITKDSPTAQLPPDLYELLRVKEEKYFLQQLPYDDSGRMFTKINPGYHLFANEIEPVNIKYPNTITIWYYRYPEEITSIEDTPDIKSQFHHALKYYFLAHYPEMEPEERAQYFERYHLIRQEIDQQTRKQVGHRTRKVRTRFWA